MSQPTPTPDTTASGGGGSGASQAPSDVSSLTGTQPSRGDGRGRGGRRGGRFRGGRGGRGGRFNGGGRRDDRRPPPVKNEVFKGRITSLKDKDAAYRLDNAAEAKAMYKKVTEEIANYIGGSESGLKFGGTIKNMILYKGKGEPKKPVRPTNGDQVDIDIYNAEIKEFTSEKRKIQTERITTCTIIKNQCDAAIVSQIQSMPNHREIMIDGEVMELLAQIQQVMYRFYGRKSAVQLADEAKRECYDHGQKKMSNQDFYDTLASLVEAAEQCGVSFHDDNLVEVYLNGIGKSMLLPDDAPEDKKATAAEIRQMKGVVRNHTLGMMMFKQADDDRYAKLKQDIQNFYATNPTDNRFPTSMESCKDLLNTWTNDYEKQEQQKMQQRISSAAGTRTADRSVTTDNNNNNNTIFNQDGEVVEDGQAFVQSGEYRRCYRCGRRGHVVADCTSTTTLPGWNGDNHRSGYNAFMDAVFDDDTPDFMFFQKCRVVSETAHAQAQRKPTPQRKQKKMNEFELLLDNQSTLNMISNPKLLRNIRATKTWCHIKCNAGVATTNMIGDLPGYPDPVWYHPYGIANILSQSEVEKHFPVEKRIGETFFRVHKPDGSQRLFLRNDKGLHYVDTKNPEKHTIEAPKKETETKSDEVALVTVEDKKSKYTVANYKRAEVARDLQEMIGPPTTKKLLKIVDNNQLKNNPVMRRDVLAAEDIFGKSVFKLQGTTTNTKSESVEVLRYQVPEEIIEQYGNVTIGIDIMYINKIPFLVSISHNLKYGTIERLHNRQVDTILNGIKRIQSTYSHAGFTLHICRADGEFAVLETELKDIGIDLNTTAENEHVPEVERYIRTIKERTRCVYNSVPFKRMPPLMVAEMAIGSVLWLNAFPADDGTSDTISPLQMIEGKILDYNKHCRVKCGTYVQTHEDGDNTMKSRTVGAIALRPTGNDQGSYYFMSLDTGKRITRKSWDALPTPNHVIDRVHTLARRAKAQAGLTHAWRDGSAIDEYTEAEYDSDEDSDYQPPDDDDDDVIDDVASTGVNNAQTDEHNYGSNEFNQHNNDEHSQPNEDEELEPRTGAQFDNVDEHYGDGHNNNTQLQHDEYEGDTEDYLSDDEQQKSTNEQDENTSENSESNDHESETDAPGERLEEQQPNADRTKIEQVDDDNSDRNEDNEITGVDSNEAVETTGVDSDDKHVIDTVPDSQRDGLRKGRLITTPWKYREIHNQVRSTGVADKNNRYAALADGPYLTTNEILKKESKQQKIRPPRDYVLAQHGLEHLEHFAMTQYTVKKGLKMFGQAGVDAVLKEAKQIHDRDVLDPKDAKMLTKEEKKKALEYLMFLKKKRCGRIKGRGCADGRKQRIYKTKEEKRSPTVTTEALFLSCVIDALEGRDVATVDIPGAFMQADMDEHIHVRFSGPMAILLAKVDPKLYNKYLTYENGKEVIYAKLKKALYGTLQAALLFWKDLTGELKKWGFEMNPYDECVANKMIDGKQCTILWHVDDLKISHVDPGVVDSIIRKLNKKYGKIAPVTETRGKKHTHLGMDIDFSQPGKVNISMDGYVEEILDEARDDMDGTVTSPAAEHLFKINPEPTALEEGDKQYFHTMVAKLLFLCKRARPDLQEAVAFLTTRVKAPDQDDYKKLARVIRYLRAEPKLPLTLEADNAHMVKWWVDAAFAVHEDMRSHTGGTMTLGKGSVCSTSIRQKLNTTSSTEAELVGVADVMPMVLWTRYFLEAQGFHVNKNYLYQDNQSAMLLEKNGKGSSGKRTRHINIRYFFVTDRINSGEVEVEYCPTGEMVADYFTKPLQGALFRKFRDAIMNIQK